MDETLKQRLVGACVLVVVAVVVVPWLLGDPIERSSNAPERKAVPGRTTETPPPSIPDARSGDPTAARPQVEKVPSPTTRTEPAATASTQPPVTAPRELQSAGGYVVQIATFSKPANARKLKQDLGDTSYPVLVEQYGEFWRVVVGPFASESDAARALRYLEKRTRLDGVVRSL